LKLGSGLLSVENREVNKLEGHGIVHERKIGVDVADAADEYGF